MSAADTMFEAVSGAGRVLLTGPVGPDGDSIGACLALAAVLRDKGVDVTVAGKIPPRYAWMPGASSIVPDEQLAGTFDAVVILDGDRFRLEPPTERHFERAMVRAIVDHHASTTPDGYTHPWIEPRAESTCSMLFWAFRRWGIELTRPLAELLYTGLIFDTGGFRHTNTTPSTHHIAAELLATGLDHGSIAIRTLCERTPAGLHAMGTILSAATYHLGGKLCVGRVPLALRALLAEKGGGLGDLEGVVDALVNTQGTDVAALLIERDDGFVKLSLRGRTSLDVANLARQIHPNGGGHPKAAGSLVQGSLDHAERVLVDTFAPYFAPSPSLPQDPR
jgi:phosphoesterase RecJ-like protein